MKIPCTIAYRKDKFDPKDRRPRPMLLTGYGAYGDTRLPQFDGNLRSLLDRGVIYAVAHVRVGVNTGPLKPSKGSAIRGAEWYNQGKLLHKKNTFNDFIECAEFFTEEGYTTKDRLAGFGR